MTVLVPMTAAEFAPFRQVSSEEYARENVESGRWLEQGSLERAFNEIDKLLPQKENTENHKLFTITCSITGKPAGNIWVFIDPEIATAFIYNLEILPEFRRQGLAQQALREIDDVAKACGAKKIGLHVFQQNSKAQALYKKMGYAVLSINMGKSLEG